VIDLKGLLLIKALRIRNPKKAKKLLSDIYIEKRTELIHKEPNTGIVAKTESTYETEKMTFVQYRAFVYNSGKVKREGAGQISEEEFNRSKSLINRLGIADSLTYRYRNITEGIAFGSYKFIEDIQVKFKRKIVKPRKVLTNDSKEDVLYSTRKLKPI